MRCSGGDFLLLINRLCYLCCWPVFCACVQLTSLERFYLYLTPILHGTTFISRIGLARMMTRFGATVLAKSHGQSCHQKIPSNSSSPLPYLLLSRPLIQSSVCRCVPVQGHLAGRMGWRMWLFLVILLKNRGIFLSAPHTLNPRGMQCMGLLSIIYSMLNCGSISTLSQMNCNFGPCSVAGHVPPLPWLRSRVWVRVGLGSQGRGG